MKIAIISDYVGQGGAAIACNRLALALAADGMTVRRFALERKAPPSCLPHGVSFAPEPYGRRAGAVIELVSAFRWQHAANVLRLREVEGRLFEAIATWEPDVINIHNLHAFSANFLLVPKLATLAPLAWTLHDMWSFTGRCAYNDDCRQFETGCTSSCPTTAEYPAVPPHLVQAQWRARADFFASTSSIVAVTPSCWLAEEARRGLWRNHRVETIPNSLDLLLYRPVERELARIALGLPPSNRPLILLAAECQSERRKGGLLLSSALAECGREITLLTLGHSIPNNLPDNVQLVHLGYLSDGRTQALAYSAADVLLHPAPTDNLPNTVIEALACGTPVLAFKTGGLPEMVKPGLTGWLSETLSARSLGKMLATAIDSISTVPLNRSTIRDFAEFTYAPESQASAYRRLFGALNETFSERFVRS